MNKYTYNENMYQWERVDRTQVYKGVKIETVCCYMDYYDAPRHRFYRVFWPDGRESHFGINKRGGNIKALKEYIDYKIR